MGKYWLNFWRTSESAFLDSMDSFSAKDGSGAVFVEYFTAHWGYSAKWSLPGVDWLVLATYNRVLANSEETGAGGFKFLLYLTRPLSPRIKLSWMNADV